MMIDKINLYHIRIFECVFRTRSMTKAADELHMTQSGISQHIRQLEDMLNVKLFDRIKQRLVPTSSAVTLFASCSEGLNTIENALHNIHGGDEYAGLISIGIPIEYGNNVVLPVLAAFGKKYPNVSFKFEYGLTSTMNDLLIQGQLNMAIVDDFQMDKLIEIQDLTSEKLYLCCLEDYFVEKSKNHGKEDKKFFESLDYIDFTAEAPLVQSWFRYHLKGSVVRINVRSAMVDVVGMAKMITEGFGVGIVPDHLLQKLRRRGYNIHVFKGRGQDLVNQMGLAMVKDRSRGPAVEALAKYIIKSLAEKK